jgi:hypothetical protein
VAAVRSSVVDDTPVSGGWYLATWKYADVASQKLEWNDQAQARPGLESEHARRHMMSRIAVLELRDRPAGCGSASHE